MRLIDADAFECELQKEWEQNNISNGEWMDIREWLRDAPTEEPKHGRWINIFNKPLKCSSCGIEGKANVITLRTDFKYCPYCGAKMDEVTDEIG